LIKIVTKRLIIRTFLSTDWKDLYEYMSDTQVVKFEPYEAFTEEDCIKECDNRSRDESHRFWAVCLKDTNKMIGHIYFAKIEPPEFFTWSIGYVFNPKYYGRGYATEASKKILEYGFNVKNAHRIIAGVNVKNEASWKLLERLAMRREAHMLQNGYFRVDSKGNPLWHDAYKYAILASEHSRVKS